MGNGRTDAITKMRKTLLDVGDFNVIQLDWSTGAKTTYEIATANTRLIGSVAAEFVKFLEKNSGADRKNFHVIGHSLGAHVAGYIGEKLEGKLGRISGVDPAGPFFYRTRPAVRLDPTDALLVDNIHTDAVLGTIQAMGHVDYYPNGGKKQPNCSNNICNHALSWEMYTNTINKNSECQYKAFPCESYKKFKDGKCKACPNDLCNCMGFKAVKKPGQSEVKLYLIAEGK